MSAARILRFIIGTVIATVLLFVLLPIAGVPSSHFLPPGHVWGQAKGVARGQITGRFYDVTNNAFDVGGKLYFVTYAFYAPAPLPGGAKGKPQVYKGTARVSQADYDAVQVTADVKNTSYNARQMVPVVTGQIARVRYEPSYPEINGPIALNDPKTLAWTPWGGRSVDGPSNNFGGWLGYSVLAFALGFGIMLILERFSARENI